MIKMISAGNAESSLKRRIALSLITFISSYLIIYALFRLISSLVGMWVDHIVLSAVTSFTLLIGMLILHVFKSSKITRDLLMLSSVLTATTYYLYVASVAITRKLTITPIPFFLIATNTTYSVYILDIPQVILLIYIINLTLKKVFTKKPSD